MSHSSHADGSAGLPEAEQHEVMVAAMAEPVRCKIFLAAVEAAFYVGSEAATGQTGISVRQIAERVQESRRRVRYHLEVLCRQGLVEVVEEKRRRGVVEHYYRAKGIPLLSKEATEKLPVRRKQKIILETLRKVFAEATAALGSETYVRRPEWAAARVHADVDEQGWTELGVIYEKTTRDALAIIAKAQERLRATGERPVRVGAAALLFECAAHEAAPDLDP